MDHFEKNNCIAKIESRKKLFREPKKANEVDTVLAEYSQCIRMCKSNSGTPIGRNGAFLLCVIGKTRCVESMSDQFIFQAQFRNDISSFNLDIFLIK